ncbi:MAG: tetratricopeptide repeat protein [Burkholderiales bacterium]
MFNLFGRKRPARSEAAAFLEYGVEAHRKGDWESARASAEQALKIEPDNPEAHYLLGLITLSRGEAAAALKHFDQALVREPDQPRHHFARGEALAAAGDFAAAAASFERAISANAADPTWWHRLGGAYIRLGQHAKAVSAFERALGAVPGDPVLLWRLGESLWHAGRTDEAVTRFGEAWRCAVALPDSGFTLSGYLVGHEDAGESEAMCRRALQGRPEHPEMRATLGLVLSRTGKVDESLSMLEATASECPDNLIAQAHYGILLRLMGRFADAAEVHQRAVALGPENVQVLTEASITLSAAGQLEAAESLLNRAIALQPESGDIHFQLGIVLRARRSLDEAELVFRRANELAGGHPGALLELSGVLVGVGRHKEAAEALFALLALNPSSAEANVNLGVALIGLGHQELGAERLRKAREIDPNNIAARINLSNHYYAAGKPSEAEKEAAGGLEIAPENRTLMLCRANALQSQGRFAESAVLIRRILAAEPEWKGPWSNLLLALNYLGESTPASLLEEHRAFGRQFTPRPLRTRASFERDATPGRRLRIGYVSPDFRNHVVGVFSEPVLRLHDRSRYEVFCYYAFTESDVVTRRFRELADIWRDIGGLTDDEAERVMLDDQLDIVVDLAGHTGHNSLPVLARRVAPVQVTWLGYPNGTGLEAMDWRITDEKADPSPVADAHHVERLYRLPETFIAYSPPSYATAVQGLPFDRQGRITFGAYNNYQKVSDEALACWKRILDRVPNSRLVTKTLTFGDPVVQAQVIERFGRFGFDMSRVELLGPVRDPVAHLETVGSADIALDTFPYNGTTTTCELLWMGVPLIALAGDRHASRVGVSLLGSVGLGDLVAADMAAYVDLAAALAADIPRLREIRRTLRDRMKTSPLTDLKRFVGELERAYDSMWREWVTHHHVPSK